jgi:PAS domain S-box-containing protein
MRSISSSFKDVSIKWRLFLLQTVLVFSIVASIGIVSSWELQKSIESNQRDRLLAVASEVANLSADNLHNAGQVLRSMAKGRAIQDYYTNNDREGLEREFIKHEILFPEISLIGDDNKEEIKVISGEPVKNFKDYKGSALQQLANNHRGIVVLGPPYISDSLKGPAVDMMCKGCGDVRNKNFTLHATLPLNLLNTAVSDIEISPGGFFILIDRNGHILASSLSKYLTLQLSIAPVNDEIGSEQLFDNKQLFGRYRLLGCDCMIAKDGATLSDIRAVVAIPYATYRAPIYHLRQSILVICLLAFLISIMAVTWIVQRFMAPITLLTKATADIAQDGALNRYVEWQSTDEIGALANSFNTMLSRLIHSKRELIYQRSYIDNVLLSLGDMLIVTDMNGLITRVNKSCEDTLEYKCADIIDVPVIRLFKDSGALISAIVDNIDKSALNRNIEATMITSGGLKIPVIVSVAPIRAESDQMCYGLVFIAKDITERKRAEAELRQKNVELQETNRRLEEANNQRLQAGH